MTHQSHGGARQRGMVLVIGLIFLLLLTIIGTTAIRTSTLDERMAENLRDRNLAFQAAEAALRDAEQDISGGGARVINGFTGFTVDCGASTSGNPMDDGLCYNGASGDYTTDIWTTVDMTAAPSVEYGRFTSEGSLPNLSVQPRYIIEGIHRTVSGCTDNRYYRVTARAQGESANTVVWLQATYGCKPPPP
ncbi:Tfp pilus assembly protein PilX [Thioflavicoccus mobilis 8321]|uniref:Tfp pilus assembly protein PilX n=1 Tax=Thioflavicoccus mobilis 8321 TaxID=765912 RepID=L0H0V2_9GAMM|nr:PilX N-terminal domain-containing pilus assembly protein [Thioflavicoccus mobilis]AGA91846.1 Tfp pilus assembly protein PilX [Thioflavicoccus mobilis 8321]